MMSGERAVALLERRFHDQSKDFSRACVAALFREIKRLQKRDEMAQAYIEELHLNGPRESVSADATLNRGVNI